MTLRINEDLLGLDNATIQQLLEGVHAHEPVSGLTHGFYRYPACFSPRFAAAAIKAFTKPGELVLDPFMGGATTMVEASALGRRAIGLDINSLACFIANAKTTTLTDSDITALRRWTRTTIGELHMWNPAKRAEGWIEQGYQRNINSRRTWPIRKCLELAVDRVSLLKAEHQQIFARALILRTAQWALDCRSDVPSASQFRDRLLVFLDDMVKGAKAYRLALDSSWEHAHGSTPLILNRSAAGLETETAVTRLGAPKLVLTSPPYPGVHVMYHRWQVLGRRETPAPYWVANTFDGNGLSYYTFGDRQYPELKTYFDSAFATFRSVAAIANCETLFVQMVAFSDASWQLPKYLHTMRCAGLVEVRMADLSNGEDGRVWRTIPHRRWYAGQRGSGGAGREVVLFHRLSEAKRN